MWSSTTIRLPFTSAPQLAGQGGAACHAQRHEHAGDYQCPAVFQLHAGDPRLTPRMASTASVRTATSGGNCAVSGAPPVSRVTL